tara:strand:+ start:174 stop:593 length:420 start_codon:yes stop_codon:yes gene_type:complete
MVPLAIFLVGCGSEDPRAEDSEDPRAEDKARIVEMELGLGHITKEEAECSAEVLSDFFSDDEKWAAFMSLSEGTFEEQMAMGEALGERMADGSASEEDKKLFGVAMESFAAIPKVSSECEIDLFEISRKRQEDLFAPGL